MFISTANKVSTKIVRQELQYDRQAIARIKNIIAISSGSGRVGKNVIAVNTAVSLAQMGLKVGLLDADPNSTNARDILGLKHSYLPVSDEKYEPVNNFGVKLVSFASLNEAESLESCGDNWLDPTVSQIIERVAWGDLDYLLVNLPPGIGELQLALARILTFDNVIMIATSRNTQTDTYETLKMFEQLQVPIIGLIENMSDKIAPGLPKRKCEIRGGEKLRSKIRIPYLGYIPLDRKVSEYSDRGLPIVLTEPGSLFASALNTIVWAIVSKTTIASLKF